MKLWLVEYIGRLPYDDNPWFPPYDKNFSFVIRAKTEEQARQFACESAGDEGGNAWLSAKYSTCVELTAEGEKGVIIVASCDG